MWLIFAAAGYSICLCCVPFMHFGIDRKVHFLILHFWATSSIMTCVFSSTWPVVILYVCLYFQTQTPRYIPICFHIPFLLPHLGLTHLPHWRMPTDQASGLPARPACMAVSQAGGDRLDRHAFERTQGLRPVVTFPGVWRAVLEGGHLC